MNKGDFLVLTRFDILPFAYSGNRIQLYPNTAELWDQTVLNRRIVEILDSHGARGAFSTAYTILKEHSDYLVPIKKSAVPHEITWQLHLLEDRAFRESWDREIISNFMGDYDYDTINDIIEAAEDELVRATGTPSMVSLNLGMNMNSDLLKILEERGYLVQGDYSPNADYRRISMQGTCIYEKGDSANITCCSPAYPYSPNNIYRPNWWDAMLFGDMDIIEIPITQFLSKDGKVCYNFNDTLEHITERITELYNRRDVVATCILPFQTYNFSNGPEPDDICEDLLDKLDQVLSFAEEQLPDARFMNYLEAREAYLYLESHTDKGTYNVLDVNNGLLVKGHDQTLKFHSNGARCWNSDSVLKNVIDQENGIAQWLYLDAQNGPRVEAKVEDKFYINPAAITFDIILDGVPMNIPRKQLDYTYDARQDVLLINIRHHDMNCTVQFRYEILLDVNTVKCFVELNDPLGRSAEVMCETNLHPSFSFKKQTSNVVKLSSTQPLYFKIEHPYGEVRVNKSEFRTMVQIHYPIGNELPTEISLVTSPYMIDERD